MEDKKLINLIKLAIIDKQRQDLYLGNIPYMSGEEKIRLGLQVWQIWLEKLEVQTEMEMHSMIEEMSKSSGSIEYKPEDFQKAETNAINTMIKSQIGVEEEDELDELRSELAAIQNVVQTHDKEIGEIKSRLI